MRAGQILKIFTVFAVLCVSTTTLISAQKPFAGTWKLNVTKSTFPPGKGIKEMTLTVKQNGEVINSGRRRVRQPSYCGS